MLRAIHQAAGQALAPSSCVQALGLSKWHELQVHAGSLHTSLSQMFYKLLVFYYYCEDYLHDNITLQADVLAVTFCSDDFMECLKCS